MLSDGDLEGYTVLALYIVAYIVAKCQLKLSTMAVCRAQDELNDAIVLIWVGVGDGKRQLFADC